MSTAFETWGLGFSGCDGGDIGSPQNKSIWVCGIEWGGGHDADSLLASIKEGAESPPNGYDEWKENLSYIFNWQVMKLLCAIKGGTVKEYKSFAEKVQPFVRGSNGYFKMNLYPIAFKDTNPDQWFSSFSDISGFNSKDAYMAWCKKERLPQIRKWTCQYAPELIICLGKTYISDFATAFHGDDKGFHTEIIEDREMNWVVNQDGTLVVVLPFMVNRNGLVRNTAIQKVGERIAKLLSYPRTDDE